MTAENFCLIFEMFVNGVLYIYIFHFQRLMCSFMWNFVVARVSTVCIYAVSFCCARALEWDGNGNNPM